MHSYALIHAYTTESLIFTESLYSILLTIFVGFMLVGFAVIFTNDTERLVIKPIERMMNMVEAVAADPLQHIVAAPQELVRVQIQEVEWGSVRGHR